MGKIQPHYRVGPSRSSAPVLEPVLEFRTTLTMPPSANHLYQRRRGGGVTLSKMALQFQEDVKRHIRDFLPELTRFPVDHETIYQVDIALYFDKLENPGWFEVITKGPRTGERKAKTRYKIIDYDNRIKFLQDCMVKAIGIPNDCQIFRGVQEKREDPANPRADVVVRVRQRSDFFPERRSDAPAT